MSQFLKAKIIDPVTGLPNVVTFADQTYIDQQIQLGFANKVTSITGTVNQIIVTGTIPPVLSLSNTLILPGTLTTTGDLTVNSTGYLKMAVGTTLQRPTLPAVGMTRFNTTLGVFEIYNGTSWIGLSGGSGTVSSVGINASNGLSVSGSPVTNSGTISLTLGTELQGLNNLSLVGLVSRTAVGTYNSRSIVAGIGINITNGDGVSGNPTISLGTVPISSLSGYPSNSNLFLNGLGSWTIPTAMVILPLNLYTSSLAESGITIYNSNNSSYASGFRAYNQNTGYGVEFGLNNSTSEGYILAGSTLSLKFGTNGTTRMKIDSSGFIDCYSNDIITSGTINAGTLRISNLATYSSSSINCQNPLSNLTLGSNLNLNGYKITQGWSTLGFVNGTVEISSGMMVGRYYSTYGYLNSGGNTGRSDGTNIYSLVCADRIAASEFNATSSKKIKKIECNTNCIIQDLKDQFLRLNFYKYSYIDEQDGRGDHYGIIAEDLADILPQFVDLNRKRYVPNCVDNKGKMAEAIFEYVINNVFIFSHKLDLTLIDKESKLIKLFINGYFYEVEIKKITHSTLEVAFNTRDLSSVNHYLVKGFIAYIYGTHEKCPTVEKNKLAEIGLILLQALIKKVDQLQEEKIK